MPTLKINRTEPFKWIALAILLTMVNPVFAQKSYNIMNYGANNKGKEKITVLDCQCN